MGAMTVSGTPKVFCNLPGCKIAEVLVTGSSSYATGGDSIDLSTSGTLGQALGFQKVTGVIPCGPTAAADTKYLIFFVPGASDAPSAGLMKIHDSSAASDAEIASTTNLSGSSFRFLVLGT